MSQRKAVTKHKSTDIAGRPDFLGTGNRGSENVTADDLIIPRVDVIQALSPQRKKTNAAYIEGAEEGKLFNSVTGHIYGDEITIIPVMFKKEWVVWKDRDTGGGFRGAFDSLADAKDAINHMEDGDSCEAIETGQHYVLIEHEDGHLEEAILSMSRSKMSTSKKLNSLARIAEGDRFSRRYQLNAVEVDGSKGEYWSYSVKMHDGYVSEEQYQCGETMYENIVGGKRSIDREADVA